MSYQLVVIRGRSEVKAHKLGPGVTVIGRQEGCSLLVRSSQVSRRHCELYEQQGRLIVRDLDSSNGTLVNGVKIEGPQVLSAGDELDLGGVKFRVDLPGAAAPPAKPVAPRTSTKPGDTAVPLPVEDDTEIAEVLYDEELPEEPILIDEPASIETPAIPVAVERPVTPVSIPAPPPVPASPEDKRATDLGEDAVADFLLNLDLDENDKA